MTTQQAPSNTAALEENLAQDFTRRVAESFTAKGALTGATSGFVYRPTQQAFALAVAKTIIERGTLVAEAGTGTGKTFAYLTPALLAGCKVIVSTAGKPLQDQLFERDLPAVEKALGVSAQAALLKGRSNYICLYRLEQARKEGRLLSAQEVKELRRIEIFAQRDKEGDRARSGVSEGSTLWPQVTSTADNCLGNKCPFADRCFINRARNKARKAQIVVVNHHLFLSAMAVSEESDDNAKMLPTADVVIFDEAHKLPDIAGQFFGSELSSYQLRTMAREMRDRGASQYRSLANWNDLGDRALHKLDEYQLSIATAGLDENASCEMAALENPGACSKALREAKDALVGLAAAVQKCAGEDAEDFAQLAAAAIAAGAEMEHWAKILDDPAAAPKKEAEPCVLWVSRTKFAVVLHQTPISFAEDFARLRQAHAGTAWIFTSATLATGAGNFSHFEREMGLPADTPAQVFPSPFAYHHQAVLYVPRGMPTPGQGFARDSFNARLVEETWPLIDMVQGRTFVLCTSYSSMKSIAEMIKLRVQANQRPYEVMVQGDEASRSELVEKFRQHGHAILVGTMSFWEGIDIKGEALSLVIVDKLPFPSKDDPVLKARCEWIEQQGENGFFTHLLPLTIITLKQGVGRLIRSETDRGIIVIGDPRVAGGKSYSREIYQSLPDFLRTLDVSRVNDFWLHPEKGADEGW